MRRALPPPDPHDLVQLTSGDVTVTVAPTLGGRIAQITVGPQPLLVDVPVTDVTPTSWGMFPMAPWVGRVRSGRFTFEGIEHQLISNHVDGGGGPGREHSIHGTVFARPWIIDDAATDRMTMHSPLTGALDWPFEGVASQHIAVDGTSVTCELRIDTDQDAFPAELGWHPWFRKPEHLDFSPSAMYRRDRFGIPTGELTEPVPGPWDDCFVNTEPVRLHYGRPHAPTVTIESDCNHWVVYDEPADATCVEPQSGPPDAFALSPHLVERSSPLQRIMTISW